MKRCYLLIVILILTGCGGNLYQKHNEFRSMNRQHLTKLFIGMSQDSAVAIMGDTTYVVKGQWRGALYGGYEKDYLNNPYRVETYTGKDSTPLTVYYYHTDIKQADGAVTDDELTPLVFIERKLIGWGWPAMNETVEKYEIRIR